jgi:hypothetical protein
MSMVRRVALVVIGAALLTSISLAATTAKKFTREIKDGTLSVISMDSGAKKYRVKHNPRGVGLGPQSANWYGNEGFLEIFVDKDDASKQPAKVELVKEGPNSAITKITWEFKQGPVTATFELKDRDDKLFVTFTFPKATKREIRLRCYPSDFAGGSKQGKGIRRRHILTPTSDHAIFDEITEREKPVKRKLAPEENWVLFMDDHFDVAKTEKKTNGPCAIFLNPAECGSAKVYVGNYSSTITLAPKADSDTLKCILWDFTGKTNAEAIKNMKAITTDLLAAP